VTGPGELREIADVVRPGLRLLLVGINPGVRSAQMGAHFAGRGNRFWPALHAAGITPELLGPERQHELLDLGVGITNLVARPSARADELTVEELRAGARALARKVAEHRPLVVGMLGLTAYRSAFGRPRAVAGRQEEDLAGAIVHLLPNPSGLNAHARPADHAAALRAAAKDAGLLSDREHGEGPDHDRQHRRDDAEQSPGIAT
jgi:double-stranded uracil-DNA glycosylase